jgi:hypothetical protein
MKIDPLPRMRSGGADICFVIIGEGDRAGQIKSVRYGSGINSELLAVRTDYDQNGKPFHSLHIDSKYAGRGWRLLYDQYMEEDGDDARYFDFLDFHAAAVRGRVDVESNADSIVPGLPDYMLPEYCRSLYSKARDREQGKWKPRTPPPEKKTSGRTSKLA